MTLFIENRADLGSCQLNVTHVNVVSDVLWTNVVLPTFFLFTTVTHYNDLKTEDSWGALNLSRSTWSSNALSTKPQSMVFKVYEIILVL